MVIESKYQTHGDNSSKFLSLLSYILKNTVIYLFPLLFLFQVQHSFNSLKVHILATIAIFFFVAL